MAILTGGLLGSSRNRIGSIVTYRLKGQDVARSLAANITNPRTAAQQTQRVKMANVVAMYRANRPWMERLAFEGRPQSWSVYNAFVSANITANSVYLTKSQADRGDCIVAPYKVTNGSLAPVVVQQFTGTTNQWKTNLHTGELTLANATVGDVSSALIERNNGIYNGMQISLVVNYQQAYDGRYNSVVRYYEMIVDTSDTTAFTSRMPDEHIRIVDGALGFATGDSDPALGFAFILSADEGSRTKVSPQNLVLTDPALWASYGTDSQLARARASYGSSPDLFLAGGYQGSSDSSVMLGLSILRAQKGDETPVNVGDYLGAWGTELAQNIVLTLSATPEYPPASMSVITSLNEIHQTQEVSFAGNQVTGRFGGSTINPASVLLTIQVRLANGLVLEANFAEDDDGWPTDGDVTE